MSSAEHSFDGDVNTLPAWRLSVAGNNPRAWLWNGVLPGVEVSTSVSVRDHTPIMGQAVNFSCSQFRSEGSFEDRH